MKYKVSFDLDFKRNPYPGTYIALEGIEAGGKTTQVQRLKKYFESLGKEVLLVKEPSREGLIGKLIHEILRAKVKIPPQAFQYLFSAERVILQQTKIIPALKSGKGVISDRIFWSAVPYGIADRDGVNYGDETCNFLLIAQGILSMYHQFIFPNFAFYLDISVEEALKRLAKMTKEKEIYDEKEKLEKVVLGYRWLSKQFPKEITVINGENPVEEITRDIIKEISRERNS